MKFRSKETVSPIREKARKRVSRLDSVSILDWSDQAGSGVARALDDYRRTGAAESLQEAREGLEALLGCVDVLQDRV